ncbi:MAG: YgjP-like metallopeptidase domain-containing protein, partial [Limisphaerales bacterium]
MKTALYKLELGQENVDVTFSRHNKARRYILRFQDGMARVTIPRGGTLQYAQEFARKNSVWIENQLRRAPGHWRDGTEILFRGEHLTLKILRTDATLIATFTDQVVHLHPDDDLRLAVEARMRTLAAKEL